MKQSKTIVYHLSLYFVLLIAPLSSFYLTSQPLPRAGGKLPERRTTWQLQATTTTVRVGFVGCGTIAVAIARGLARIGDESQIKVESIAVSRRSEAKSRVLADSFPELVTIHDETQNILNNSDLIFLCVLPQQTSEVLKSLSFDSSRHTLVSLASTTTLKELETGSKLDSERVSKLICLPAVARHQGICLHCAPHPEPFLTSLFEALGGVITTNNEKQMNALMVTTNVMGPLYGLLKQGRDFLVQHAGISQESASYLIIKQCLAIVQDADVGCEDDATRLDNLIEEQTPGGINEQALKNLDKLGGFEKQAKMMDAILSRLNGDTDGSI